MSAVIKWMGYRPKQTRISFHKHGTVCKKNATGSSIGSGTLVLSLFKKSFLKYGNWLPEWHWFSQVLVLDDPDPRVHSLADGVCVSNSAVVLHSCSPVNILFFCSKMTFALRTLKAGKPTPRILKLFVSTGKEEVLSLIQALNIQIVLTPLLPTIDSYFSAESPGAV
ncbi:hypothetical protein Tco_0604571 [Tanacetum coccineum]